MTDLSYITDNINKYLSLRGMTQAELARKTNSGYTTVNAWCTGRKLPSVSSLAVIADALGVGMDDLVVPMMYEPTGEHELTDPCGRLYSDLFGVGYKDMPLNCETLVNRAMTEMLNETERYVLLRRYGLNRYEKETLDKISKELKISRERVRQIENKAKEKLIKKKCMLLPDFDKNLTGNNESNGNLAWADNVPVNELNLSTRVSNCMYKNKIRNLGDILRMKDMEMAGMKGLGPQSMAELNRLRRLVWSHEDMGAKVMTLI